VTVRLGMYAQNSSLPEIHIVLILRLVLTASIHPQTQGAWARTPMLFRNPGYNDATGSSAGYAGWADNTAQQYGLSPAQAWGLGFLHELSHATGKFVHPGDTPPSGNTQVVTSNELNAMIDEACFKQ